MKKQAKHDNAISLGSLRQVRALAHPLRFRAFERLIDAALSGKQLAELLHTKPTHLYHHLKVLERAGLIEKVSTRRKRGTIEKYYQARSDRVVLDERLFRGRVNASHALPGEILRVTYDELMAAAESTSRGLATGPVLLKRLRFRWPTAGAEELLQRFEEFLETFEKGKGKTNDAEYALTVALYPAESVPTELSSNPQKTRAKN